MLYYGFLTKYLIIFVTLAIHEFAHIIAASLQKGAFRSLRIFPVGLNAEIDAKSMSCKTALLTDISGPFMNILLFLLCMLLDAYYFTFSDNMRFFIYVNISLALFNLLPIIPLDGGRILQEILSAKIGIYKAYRYTRRISRGILLVLIVIGLIQFRHNVHNFSLMIISGYIFYFLKYEDEGVSLMNIKNLVYKQARFLRKGVYPGRELVVLSSKRLNDIIKDMDYDRFHIIYVLDGEMKLIRVFTEQEIIENMVRLNSNITFDELIKDLDKTIKNIEKELLD